MKKLSWETVGATRIWQPGPGGYTVAILVEPSGKNSADFKEVALASKRFHEACRRGDFICRAVNNYDPMLQALKNVELIASVNGPAITDGSRMHQILVDVIAEAEKKPSKKEGAL